MHRFLTTNITLKRMKVTNNEKYTFCNTHSETIPHLFWSCDIVQHFWLMFETFVNEKCIIMTNMKLTEDFVLFGNAKTLNQVKSLTLLFCLQSFFLYPDGK